MTTAIVFAALMAGGTFSLGLFDVKQKKYLTQGIDEQVILTVTFIGTGLIALLAVLIVGVPEIKSGFLLAALSTITINVVAQNLLIRAFKAEEASLISPIRLVTTPLVIVTGFLLLNEQPSISGIIGIFVTILGLGILMHSMRAFSFSFPFRLSKGVTYGIIAAVLFSISFPLDKITVLTSSALFAVAVTFLGVGTITALLNISRDHKFIPKTFQTMKITGSGLLYLSLLQGVGNILTNQAFNYSLTAYAASLKRLQALWTVLLAGTFLKEKNIKMRFVATLVMFAGILISVISQ
ncbi:EamA family transporter [Acetobacteraceae bacterium]|nr:EamA family transporter [Candidatus Parcubacteria bacterium]